MKQLKTLHFPNEAEPREIVDAYARERIENLTASSDAPVLDVVYDDETEIITYNNSPAFDEWLTEVEGSEKFAPSGYGYGEPAELISADGETELETALDAIVATMQNLEIKQICFSDGSNGISRGTTLYGRLIRFFSGYACLFAESYTNNGVKIQKIKYGGTWYPFEWENPPMALGVEYRTTERWQSKPVYIKLVDCGQLPNTSSKNIEYNASGIVDEPVFWYGVFANQQVALANNDTMNVFVSKTTIIIETLRDVSSFTAQIAVKYTKQ